jgi:GNAT superfamily N-acetyltransferase
MFGKGLQSKGMTSATIAFPVELRDQTEADDAFVDGLVRGNLGGALGMPEGLDPAPLIEMQMRSRAMMLEQSFPDLRRRVAWVGVEPVAVLLIGTRDGALHVVEILTAPDWRRRGVAAAILAQVALEAQAQGRDVTAHIFVTNSASLALFAGAGFTLEVSPSAAQAFAQLRTDINVTSDMV